MFGLLNNLSAYDDPRLRAAFGLLKQQAEGQPAEPPPMAPPPGMTINPVGRPIPGQPQDYNDARNDAGNFQAQVTPARQMLPPINIGQPPSPPPQPSVPPPMMTGAPLPQGPEPDVPLPPQRPPEFSAPTPDQRQLQATTAGTPQDQQPQSGPFGMDLSKLGEGLSGGLDRMTSDPLFNLGIGILSNPRNIGQGLAAGLQSARAAKDSDRRNKLAEQAANRKNIHWFMRPDGTLAGVNVDDPSQLVVPPGQTPKNTEGKILQPGEGGVPQGFIGVQNPGGAISLHPMPQTQEQKLAGVEAEAAAKARGKASVEAGGVAGAPKITEFDKKAMDKADEALALGKTSMGAIKMARELSKGSSQNPGSAFFAPGAAVMGADWGVKTENLKNLLTGEGLNNLKAAFGGNPTEGERKVQLELMGAMGQPDAVRQKIFDNYERVLKNRMNFNLAKSRALRDRSYYDPSSEFYKKFNEYITAESEIPGEGAPPPSGEAPPPASGSVETAPQTAINRKTGERMILRNGQWEKM